ncbi:hypothetical protein LDENG_00087220 [Lucifuga dentata]|nr:hypothetical protein LDENG_00087220 [Lucifuga dentata]
MVRISLLLLLLNTSACCGFGFKGCSQNYPQTDVMWCFNQNIANLSDVLSMIPDNTTTINLSKNKIRSIPSGSFSHLLHLKYLDLSQNQLAALKGGEFKGLDLLDRLNLSCNNISRIDPNAFDGLTRLRLLLLMHNQIVHVLPGVFNFLPAIQELDLSLNRLQTFSCGECGGSSTLTHLDLLANNIQRLNVSGFPALEYIRLSNNSKLELQADAFAYNPRLKSLLLQGVKAEIVLGLSVETKRRLSWVSFSVSVEKSPFTICGLLKGMDQLERVEVSYLYDLRCDDNRRSTFRWQFDDKACSYEEISFNIFIGSAVVDVLFVCVCLVWHTQGPALRYLLLILRAKLRGRRGTAKANFQFDAFISYSSRDEAWVLGQLVPRLERPAAGAPGLRLCLHHRDFRPGATVLENIEAAIYGSRHTICVMTRHFLQSEWCSMEFQLASLRLLCDGSDVLLLVFLEEIPEYCLSPHTRLRKFVRKKTYLLWPASAEEQEAFWFRLVDALKGNEEDEEGRGEELAKLTG